MKKFIFTLLAVILLSGCSIDNVKQDFYFELAEITGNDLPDEFEIGETYQITVNYVLPSLCSTFSGIDARRAGVSGDLRREIYVSAISQVNANSNCSDDQAGATGNSKFSLFIDEREDYTFKFWKGETATGDPVYETVVVPVSGTTGGGQNQ